MKKLIAVGLSIYLFAGSLLPGNGFACISELPLLLQHFRYHSRVENPGISFSEFLAMHYNNFSHQNSDPSHHKNLPFRHQMANNGTTDKIVVSDTFDKTVTVSEPVNILIPDWDNFFLPSVTLQGIFHPPRA